MNNVVKNKPSLIGGSCIIASICVGAGMLGLPIVGVGAWTIWSTVAISITMIVMTISGWMLLESFKHYDVKVSFNTVTKEMLGDNITRLNNIAVYFVGSILLYAYITSSGIIIADILKINNKITSIVFVLVFSACVWHSTRTVDRVSVILIATMIFSFIFSTTDLVVNIEITKLFDSISKEAQYFPYAIAILPVALTSFGYHHSVTTMRAYYQEETRAKYAILGGTTIALSFYLLWIFGIYGNLTREQIGLVINQGGNIDTLLSVLGTVINSTLVKKSLSIFSIAAILSSFIGVGLGVFDFLADLFKFENTKKGRAKTWVITFFPPLIMSLLFPFGFIFAISYAGAVATFWTCFIPALLVLKSRKRQNENTGFKAPGGMFMIILVMGFGIFTAIFHFMSMLKLLPVFTDY